jgi:hypothetical protein
MKVLVIRIDVTLARNIIRSMVPNPDVALVSSFYLGEATNDRTFIFPPILRDAVLVKFKN